MTPPDTTMGIGQLLSVVPGLSSIPLGALLAVLTLLPLVSGALVFSFRTRAVQRGAVIATGLALSAASLLLFVLGAAHHTALAYNPPHLAGVSWNAIITIADFALLCAFIAIGVARRSALITLLALLQCVPLAWFEFTHHAMTEVEPALVADWLAMAMVLLVSIIGSIVAVYALPYMRDHEEHLHLKQSTRYRLFAVILLFLGAMNGLVLSNNLLWIYFFWEVTTLCSFLLIGHDATEEATANAGRALWMNLLGGVGFVAGIVLLGLGEGTLSVQELLQMAPFASSHGATLMLPLACLCFAGFTKAAQMPFQNWLLGAMVAPTPVSALLHSSTMVKAGVYLILRFAPLYHDTALSNAVALAGGFTFVASAMLAISQSNAKRVLAYSTISNLGLIIACAGLNTPLAVTAALMLVIFHAISKGLLFMAVGVVEHNIHSRDIEDMQGLITRMPLTTSLMIVGILSMLLPPFGVLIAKLAAIEASARLFPALALLVIGSTLTVMFWTKWMGRLLTADAALTAPVKIEKLHVLYRGPLLLLASAAVLCSLFVIPLLTGLVEPAVRQSYALLSAGHDTQMAATALSVPWTVIYGVLTFALLLPLWLARTHPDKLAGAYFCGEQVADGGAVTFVGALDERTEPMLGGFYFLPAVGETRHARWMSAVALAALALLFASSFWPL